jgi:hypothetical protein
MPYEVDVRGQKMPGGIWHVPPDFDFKYDKILTDPPDNRSPMIKMLDQRENP